MENQSGDRAPCPLGCGKTFSREPDAKRHAKEVDHGKDTTKHCMIPGCLWKGAKRDGRHEKHMATAHNIVLEFPPSFVDDVASSSIGHQPEEVHAQGPIPAGINVTSSSNNEPFQQESEYPHYKMPYNATSPIGNNEHRIIGAPSSWDQSSRLGQQQYQHSGDLHPPMMLHYAHGTNVHENQTAENNGVGRHANVHNCEEEGQVGNGADGLW